MHFDAGWIATPVFDRADLAIGTRLAGPAVIDEMSATTLVPPGCAISVDRSGNLLMEIARMTRLADPIAMEVFSNRLLSITEDMGSTLIRSSFSTNIKERKDCSVGLFDATRPARSRRRRTFRCISARCWAACRRCSRATRSTRCTTATRSCCNDPYLAGGTHMPDISIVTPVFIDGAVRAFAANVGHHSDVGGPVPGFDLRPRALGLRGRPAPAGDPPGARRRAGRGPAGADRAQLARSG